MSVELFSAVSSLLLSASALRIVDLIARLPEDPKSVTGDLQRLEKKGLVEIDGPIPSDNIIEIINKIQSENENAFRDQPFSELRRKIIHALLENENLASTKVKLSKEGRRQAIRS